MSERPDTSDRRAFPRLKESCSIRYKLIDDEGIQREGADGLTVNISGGGVRFASEEAITAGALLAIELALPGFETSIISLGRVIWCDPRTDGSFEIGMEFWWVGWGDDGAQRTMSEHIKKALES